MIKTKLSNRAICDFITMLYVYDNVVNSESVNLKLIIINSLLNHIYTNCVRKWIKG
jgi:hypothetical protein